MDRGTAMTAKQTTLTVIKATLRGVCVTVAAILGGFVLGVLGLIAGALFGGNLCNTCEFNGLRGYEGMGQLGFLLGACTGAALFGWAAAVLLRKRSARRAAAARG